MSDGQIADDIRRSLRVIGASVIAMYLIVAGFAGWTYYKQYVTEQKLCDFTTELHQRVQRSKAFLEMSEAERVETYGSELGNIDEEVIANQVSQQEQSLASLGGPC